MEISQSSTCCTFTTGSGSPGRPRRESAKSCPSSILRFFDGYCGDEDNGQTSAWYVFSALGFYPVCPASGQYAVGSPLFDKVTVTPSIGKPFTVVSSGNSPENVYVKNMKVSGKNCSRNYITLSELRDGSEISFEMNSSPEKSRGTAESDRPYSFSREGK